jgi:hypothetical protein
MGLGAGEGASLEESFPLAFHPDHSTPICKVYGSGMESEGKMWINLLKSIDFLFGYHVHR